MLTDQRLRGHPNIPHLLYYDLINQEDSHVAPALIVERARYGSLAEYLDHQEGAKVGSMTDHEPLDPVLTAAEKMALCSDMIAGLLALHSTDVAHGDVKTDNFLLFENPENSQRFLAKLADFGSIIPLSPPRKRTSSRYLGTQIWNAPEVENQSNEQFLDSKGVLRCDNYSLGLCIMHIVSGVVLPELMSRKLSVLENALSSIKASQLPVEDEHLVSEIIDRLLIYEPTKRCSDLSVVQTILNSSRAQDGDQDK